MRLLSERRHHPGDDNPFQRMMTVFCLIAPITLLLHAWETVAKTAEESLQPGLPNLPNNVDGFDHDDNFRVHIPRVDGAPLPAPTHALPSISSRGPPPLSSPAALCQTLQTALGSSKVQNSTGPDYAAIVASPYDLFNTAIMPACIAFPEASEDVQVVMKGIFNANSGLGKAGIRYAVLAGGHSAMPGWNNVQNGILISFSRMAAVAFNSTTQSITVQPGIRWGDAVEQMQQFGVAPMGGRLTDIGTGLLLGGGLNYLSASEGYAVDTLRSADVVLVNGTLVTASADPSNPHKDLFRALKGGANRFGIVTRYEVDAVSVGGNGTSGGDRQFFGGLVMYSNASAPSLLAAVKNYVDTVNDPKAAVLTFFATVATPNTSNPVQLTTTHISTLIYHGPSLPPAIFDPFLNTTPPPLFTQLSPLSYLEAMQLLGAGADKGFHLYGASVLGQNVPLSQYTKMFSVTNAYTESLGAISIPAVGGSSSGSSASQQSALTSVVLAFTPVQKGQVAAGTSGGRSGNVISPPAGKGFVAVQVDTEFNFAAGTTGVMSEVKRVRDKLFRELPRTPGLPLYVNECDASQNVFASYGAFDEIKRTYKKYDPTRFNVRFTNGPNGL